jgi:hypothetical protein
MRNLLGLCLLLVLTGCNPNSTRDREDYGVITNTQITDRAQHPAGWGRRDCLLCHNVSNIHRRPGAPVDGDSIAQMARDNGPGICLICHGTNGVSP